MLVCWVVGRAVGALAQRTLDAHIESYKTRYPIPDIDVQQVSDIATSDANVDADQAAALPHTSEEPSAPPGT